MKLNEKIKSERDKRQLTVDAFSTQLYERVGMKKSTKTIQRWEKGDSKPQLVEIIELANFFEIKPSELLNEDTISWKAEANEILRLGKDIYDYSQMNNINDLLNIFYITTKKDFRMLPRYDIELRSANEFLKYENSFTATMNFLEELLRWSQSSKEIMKRNTFENRKIVIHDDSSGSRSHYDPRVVTDYKEIVLAKESILSNLYYLVSEMNNSYDESDLANTYFVKKNTFI